MNGELSILVLVLLSATVGVAILVSHLRKRGRGSHAEPRRSIQDSASRNPDETELGREQDVPLPTEASSENEAEWMTQVLDEEGRPATPTSAAYEVIINLDESERRDEPRLQPDDGAENGHLGNAPHNESQEVSSKDDYSLVHEEAPLEIGLPNSEAILFITPDNHKPGVAPRESSGASTAATTRDHQREGACNEQTCPRAEPAPSNASNEETASSDVPALSSRGAVTSEELEEEKSAGNEQPQRAPYHYELRDSTDKDDSMRGVLLEAPASDDATFCSGKQSGDSNACSQHRAVVDADIASRDDEDCKLAIGTRSNKFDIGVGESNASGFTQTAVAVAISVATESDRASEEGRGSATADLVKVWGVDGVDDAVRTPDQDDIPAPPAAQGEECDNSPDGNEHNEDGASVTLSARERANKKKPRKYKGLARAAPKPRNAERQTARREGEEPGLRKHPLPIEVRLRFDRSGFCNVSLIAKRSEGLPEDLTATASAEEVNLRAMQNEWYQDVVPADLSRVLQDGTIWDLEGKDGRYTWSLTGRTLYVLAGRPDVSGYVSQPRLDLGRDHVVLCHESIRSRVGEAIRETGAQPTMEVDESLGAPQGWVVFRGVVPTAPVEPTGEADIFNALRPLPQVQISLERGIRFEYGRWLDGYPPAIRVYGYAEHTAEVHIDGQLAVHDADGAYSVPNWDSLGRHTVWCSETSKSYTIVPFEASSELWEAYAFSISPTGERRLAICGPIVRAMATELTGSGDSLSVPDSNPVLLGPEPGQIVTAVRASSAGGGPCVGSPWFRPIWALPQDPLHCDKKSVRIMLLAGGSEALNVPSNARGLVAGADVDTWCRLILDAGRKGMKTDPDTEAVRAQWLLYRRLARRIWRGRR